MSQTMFHLLGVAIALVAVQLSTAKSVVGSINAFQVIEAEYYSYSNRSTFCGGCTQTAPTAYICDNGPQSTVGYYGVDFATGAVRANFNVDASIKPGQSAAIDVHLDDPQSPPFATIDLINTGGKCNWTTLSTVVTTIPSGFHDVYLTFTEVNYINMYYYVDWFSFDATSGNQTRFDAFQLIEAEDYNYAQVAHYNYCPGSSITYAGDLKSGTVLTYFGVNFGVGPQIVKLRIAAWDKGTVYLHLDSTLNEPFATIPIQKIGQEVDYCNFAVIQQFVTDVPTGVHDLYLTVDLPAGVDDFINVDWLSFESSSA